MQTNFPKIPLFLSIVICICSCALFVFFYKTIDSGNKESQAIEKEWQAEEKRREEIKTLDSLVHAIESERGRLDTHFAKSSDVVPFLDTVEGLAPLAGAKTETTSVEILKDNTGLLVVMKVSGNFGSVYKFLTLLEHAPYQLEFVKMEIHKQPTENTGTKAAMPLWEGVFSIKLLSFIK